MLIHDSTERWLPIEGWEGYEVSDRGRVRTWRKWCRFGGMMDQPRVMKLRKTKLGYYMVMLTNKPRRKNAGVHRLVLDAFVGPCPGKVCRHLDGNPSNNHISNLAWGTPKQNSEDMVHHGRSRSGLSKGSLTDDQVLDIRKRANAGESYVDILADYPDQQLPTIRRSATGLRYTHLPNAAPHRPRNRFKKGVSQTW